MSDEEETPYSADTYPETSIGLWNKVSITDPDYTRKVTSRGGFTAICAQYQIMVATRLWGPYGLNWGVRGHRWSMIDVKGEHAECVLDAEFFCPETKFEISACMKYQVGNDTRKKLLTDLTTKALSKLGFSADVFLGRFDDDKYVTYLKESKKKKAADRAAAKKKESEDPNNGENQEEEAKIDPNRITKNQAKMVVARMTAKKMSMDDIAKTLKDVAGVTRTEFVHPEKLNELMDVIDEWKPDQGHGQDCLVDTEEELF